MTLWHPPQKFICHISIIFGMGWESEVPSSGKTFTLSLLNIWHLV